MKKITLNIFILLIIWGLLVPLATIQAGSDDPVELDPSIMKVFQIYIPKIKNEVIEAHISLLMYSLAKNKHQYRLDMNLSPPCNKLLDIVPLQWVSKYSLETGVKTFLLYVTNDKARILMTLDFCEGYNDGTRLQLGEYSEQQIILYTHQKEKHRTQYIGDYFYAAGVNAAVSLKGKDFPWGGERFYTKEQWKLAHKKRSYKHTEQAVSDDLKEQCKPVCNYTEREGSDDPVKLAHTIMEAFQIKNEVIEAHIDLLMYYLANNNHQYRLEPIYNKRLDIRPPLLFPRQGLEAVQSFLQEAQDDKAKIFIILDFCEGYYDWRSLELGKCSEQQIILYAQQREKHRTKDIGDYIYIAGVNTAATLKGTHFPWMNEGFYTEKQWKDANKQLTKKEIQDFGF